MPHPHALARSLAIAALLAGAAVASHAQAQRPGSLERGKYLMESVVACGNCHFPRGPKGEPLFDKGLSGGMVFDVPPFRAVAANITPDAETGIGRWTDAQLARAIREGVRPGKPIIGPPMPVEFYRHLSDDDTAAIIAYLRAQPPVRNPVEKSKYRMKLPANYGPPVRKVRAPDPADKVRYGQYLVQIAHCMECHTPEDAKGRLDRSRLGAGGGVFTGGWGTSVSRNLTPHETGLRDWTDAQIAHSIRTGTDREGKPYKPPMGYAFYRNISDDDIAAIIAYLRTLAPQPFGGERK